MRTSSKCIRALHAWVYVEGTTYPHYLCIFDECGILKHTVGLEKTYQFLTILIGERGNHEVLKRLNHVFLGQTSGNLIVSQRISVFASSSCRINQEWYISQWLHACKGFFTGKSAYNFACFHCHLSIMHYFLVQMMVADIPKSNGRMRLYGA